MSLKKTVEVVAAWLEKDGHVLVAQRNADDNYGLLWEFPGGKVEKGETQKQALEREMQEELGIEVEAENLEGVFFDADEKMKIKVFLYRCHIVRGEVINKECADSKFVRLSDLSQINLAPVDSKIKEFMLRKYA